MVRDCPTWRDNAGDLIFQGLVAWGKTRDELVRVEGEVEVAEVVGIFQWYQQGKVDSLNPNQGVLACGFEERSIPKATYRTKYGHYGFVVMPFGLMNALPAFMSLMNKTLQTFLDQFVIVFIDDILIDSSSREEVN
ncbi:UNVERIFIED_CONTAM: RNA-directed DNA polymerase [Sesamum calycinum]|uniref:RNA-directed DNA polymerase n=1 Tax=Sesamum calycinum TaxID=2727403 RepID=A0AAW2J223_9LAMI